MIGRLAGNKGLKGMRMRRELYRSQISCAWGWCIGLQTKQEETWKQERMPRSDIELVRACVRVLKYPDSHPDREAVVLYDGIGQKIHTGGLIAWDFHKCRANTFSRSVSSLGGPRVPGVRAAAASHVTLGFLRTFLAACDAAKLGASLS